MQSARFKPISNGWGLPCIPDGCLGNENNSRLFIRLFNIDAFLFDVFLDLFKEFFLV